MRPWKTPDPFADLAGPLLKKMQGFEKPGPHADDPAVALTVLAKAPASVKEAAASKLDISDVTG